MRAFSFFALVFVFCGVAGCGGEADAGDATSPGGVTEHPLAISTTPQLPNGVVNSAYSATLIANGGITPHSWHVMSGSLPTGLSLDSATGVISGMPTSAVAANVSIAVTDAKAASVSAGFLLQIVPAPVVATPLAFVTGPQLPNGVVGTAYSATLVATGGIAPYRWQVASGSLPTGLSLDPATGVIAGMPTNAVAANVSIDVTDASSVSVNAGFALQIAPAPVVSTPLAFVTAALLPNGVVSTGYSATLVATGGTAPYRWQVVSGSLPTGLSLGLTTGVISGTPTGAVSANPLITVTDANAASTSAVFALRIVPASLSITTSSQLANGVINTPYSTTLAATGGTAPYRWQITAGSLPTGLSLNQSTGTISGTPTSIVNTVPSISVTDANDVSTSVGFSLRILPPPLVITTAAQLPNGVANAAYSATLAATGGITPYRWQVTAGSLPAGLSLNLNTGVISGTPTSAVNATLSITVTDANSTNTAVAFTLRIVPAPLVITTVAQLPDGVANAAYSATLAATGGTTPYRWQVTTGSLPAGLSLNLNTGVISGSPTSAVNANLSITVTDANSTSTTAAFTLRIVPPPLVILTAAQLPDGAVGTAYSTTLAATGGTAPYRWLVTSGALPAGLSLNLNTGVVSGTPTSATTGTPMISVTDANNVTTSAGFSLRIAPAPLVISTAAQLPDGMVGTGYSATLAATGGSTPYGWQVTSGALPAGLSLNLSTGVISGTPTNAVTATVTITLTDANTASTSAVFSLRILSAALAITTAAQLPDGTVGTAYSTTLAATGGTMPYRWQVTSGALPAGLSLNLNTGIISGTPTSATTGNPMISVTDANNVTTSAGFSLRTLSAPLAITTASQLPQGVVGAAYSATLSATGGTTPYRWQVTSGALPAGLSLNLNTGVISGTPTASSTASMSISVTDANSVSTSAIFGLTVNASGNGWQLVWSDEFDGTTLNTAKWLNPDTGNGCNGYTQSSIVEEDSYLDGNGNLVIRAKSQASGGCGPNHYTSGQISTKGRFTQAYGKFEFRAQMPAGGGGIWPGLWLVPFNAWPPEIDVLETVSDMGTVYMNYHWSQNGHQEALASYSNPGLATGFHTYAVEWEPGIINWYIDGVQARQAVTGPHVTNMPMGVLIDIYLGGWAGGVSAPLPQHMLVDYVRVYSRP